MSTRCLGGGPQQSASYRIQACSIGVVFYSSRLMLAMGKRISYVKNVTSISSLVFPFKRPIRRLNVQKMSPNPISYLLGQEIGGNGKQLNKNISKNRFIKDLEYEKDSVDGFD